VWCWVLSLAEQKDQREYCKYSTRVREANLGLGEALSAGLMAAVCSPFSVMMHLMKSSKQCNDKLKLKIAHRMYPHLELDGSRGLHFQSYY